MGFYEAQGQAWALLFLHPSDELVVAGAGVLLEESAAAGVLGLPDDLHSVGFVFPYPSAYQPPPFKRKELDEIIFFNDPSQ